jgi:predicted ATPase
MRGRPELDAQLQFLRLARLSEAGLVFCRGTPPQATFMFKHVLVRDVAYGSMLRPQRQHLHARIAEAYESRFPETARSQPELIAYHLTEAGMLEPAIDYWQRARLGVSPSVATRSSAAEK